MSSLAVAIVLASLVAVSAQAPAQAPPHPLDRAVTRLYNFDLPGAHAALDENTRLEPDNPLSYSLRAAVYMFGELDRLKILETRFFMSDETIAGDRARPDQAVRARLFGAVAETRRIAGARLARDPNDRDALFAMCMSASAVQDYTALVEGRLWRTLGLARETKTFADRLLALDPPVYDAYLTYGTMEYVVGSLPFFVRWFVHYEKIEGDKRRAIEDLKLVARHGRYWGPFARVLLAVVSLREGKPEEAEKLLSALSQEFPGNPLFKREAQRAADLARRRKALRR